MVLLVSWVLAVCKASRVTLVRLARWVSKVFLVFLAPSVLWANRDHSVLRDSLVQLVFVASKVSLVLSVCVDLLEQLVPLVLSAFVARLVLPVSKERWDQLV